MATSSFARRLERFEKNQKFDAAQSFVTPSEASNIPEKRGFGRGKKI